MSSYGAVYLSDGSELCSFRNEVDPLLFGLFTRSDYVELHGQEAWKFAHARYYDDVDVDEATMVGFRVRAGALRDRLDVMGVNLAIVSNEFETLRADALTRTKRHRDDFKDNEEIRADLEKEILALTELEWDSWVAAINSAVNNGGLKVKRGERKPGSITWLRSLWDYHDPRHVLRAALAALPDNEMVVLDLTDLVEGGWVGKDVDPQEVASDFINIATDGLPPIVLTEGSFDVYVLASGMQIRQPHLAGFIRFPDFSQRPEGGASALRGTLRAFAAAGIPNRIIALFDNDTAARDTVRLIDTSQLPSNISVIHLPPIELAENYPTEGPQGSHPMDVNGTAGSIELYLGTDVLTIDGHLRPVRWGGFFEKLACYQGEVSGKRAVQEAFRRKVTLATQTSDSVNQQDWTGVDLVLDAILAALNRTPNEAKP